MKQFVFKVFACFVLLVSIDFGVGTVLDVVFKDLPKHQSETATIYRDLFTEEANVLVLGSSTAMHHYNPFIIADSLGGKVFNAGMDGRDIIFSDIIFLSFLDRSDLKYVIVDLTPGGLNGNWKNRLSCLQQYYHRNRHVTDYYDKETTWQQRLKLKSNIYRYNGSLPSLFSLVIKRPVDTSYGYQPLEGRTEPFKREVVNGFSIDSAELYHLKNIVDCCRIRGVEVYLVKSPHCQYNKEFNRWLDAFANENDVEVVFEGDNQYWYDHMEFFYDKSHLNSVGANVFTKRICDYIKK